MEIAEMESFKAAFSKHWPVAAMIACIVFGGYVVPRTVQVVCDYQIEAARMEALKAPVSDLSEPLNLLRQIAQQNQQSQQKPPQAVPGPIPEAVTMALYKRDKEMEEVLKVVSGLAHQVQTMYHQSGKAPAADRYGNTPEALDDIDADVNVPYRPDPMLKALARYPGSRLITDPDTGLYVPAVTEFRETSWGGGKQLHLYRDKGLIYGQTVLHRSRIKEPEQQPKQEDKKPGFNLNLGNN